MVICLEQGVDLHMAQLMPLPLTVSCFSKIQIGFTFLVPAHLASPGQRAVKRMCVCVVSLKTKQAVPTNCNSNSIVSVVKDVTPPSMSEIKHLLSCPRAKNSNTICQKQLIRRESMW